MFSVKRAPDEMIHVDSMQSAERYLRNSSTRSPDLGLPDPRTGSGAARMPHRGDAAGSHHLNDDELLALQALQGGAQDI